MTISEIMKIISSLDWQTFFAGTAVVLSLYSLYVGTKERRKRDHETILNALQGEKEAVAFFARQLQNENIKHNRTERREVVSALVNAWIFEKSDRARAMIHAALKSTCKVNTHSDEVFAIMHDVSEKLEDYVREVYPGEQSRISDYQDRISKLEAGLKRI